MKKVALILAFFFSFFSCSEKKSNLNNGDDERHIAFIFVGGEYEFIFNEPADSTMLIEDGFVYGQRLPIWFVRNSIVVPDVFIRFYDAYGYSLIMTNEFINEQIQACNLALYANDLDEISYDIVYRNENFGLQFRIFMDNTMEAYCYFQDHVWCLEGEDIMKFDWDEIGKEIEELKESLDKSPQDPTFI